MSVRKSLGIAAVVCSCAGGAWAQNQPHPSPMPPAIAEPRDVPYPGTIRLAVDATDINRHIFRVTETIPVQAGALTLLYPQWVPGDHSPTGPLADLGGLVVTANGKRVEWVRDPVEVAAFHINVPDGVRTLDLAYQYVSPVAENEGRLTMTQEMLNLEWNAVVLYPAGHFSRQINMAPSIVLPEGWQFATALDGASTTGNTTTFAPVPLNTLVDSPLIAGRYFKRIDLDPGAATPVHLDVIADRAEYLEIKPEQIEAHKALVQQAYKVFGSHHYDHYDFLLWLSDTMGGEGLEHHRSSEDGTKTTYFTEWDKSPNLRDLLAHEYTHSWNGKFRRPADLWTPNFNVPMRGSLLWVYEGQTQYWGYILGARAGLISKQDALDAIAGAAANEDAQAGRQWKDLADTTNDPVVNMRRPNPWRSWIRSEDYYTEGELIWLDADTLIRELSGGKKSLDDFTRAFYGIDNGSYVTVTYTFADVVRTLNAVQPYDWAKFLTTRLESHGPGAPLDGIARGGYKLTYTDKPSGYFKSGESERKSTDLNYSLGFVVGKEGRLSTVQWGGLAFNAGLTLGNQIIAVNGTAYEADLLKDAITHAKDDKAPIALLIKSENQYKTINIDYHGGLRYPHLERDESKPARLDDILATRN